MANLQEEKQLRCTICRQDLKPNDQAGESDAKYCPDCLFEQKELAKLDKLLDIEQKREQSIQKLVRNIQKQDYEDLVNDLIFQLRTRKSIVMSVDQIRDIDEWRKAARAAGRKLGIVTRTGLSVDKTRVWATESV